MDRRVVLQRRVMVPDSTGQLLENWQPVEPAAWAQVLWQKGAASFDGTSNVRSSVHEVALRIRYRAGLTSADWRVVFDGQVFSIDAIAETRKREELELTCRAFEVESGPGGQG